MEFELVDIKISIYDDSNKEHNEMLMELEGDSKSSDIHDIRTRLLNGKYKKDIPFDVGFVVSLYDKVIGYVFVSKRVKDEIFLEYSLIKKFRGMGYGKKLLDEVSEYLMCNYNISGITLDISPSNVSSVRTAVSVGYIVDEDEYLERHMEGRILYRRDNYNYVNKRKNRK